MRPDYKELLKSAKFFPDAPLPDETLYEKCRNVLALYFKNSAEFNTGAFLGKSIIDEVDAKNALIQIINKTLNKDDAAAFATALSDVSIDKNKLIALNAMLAGYISSLLK